MTGSDGDARPAGPVVSPAVPADPAMSADPTSSPEPTSSGDPAGAADGVSGDPLSTAPATTVAPPGAPAARAASVAAPGAPDAPGAPAAPGPPERHTLLALLDAVGGPAALIDSAAPTIVFALTYTLDSRHLRPALYAAVGVAVLLAIWRLIRRQSMHTVAGGLLGIALAAGIAEATGRASDYYLVSIVRSLGLALLYAVSALVRWPIIGVVVGAAAGRPGGFREDPEQLRAYTRVTWLWVGLFVLRVAVRGPLLLANAFTWLSVTDVVMGWPLFLGWTALTYVLLRRWLHGSVWEAAREGILARNARTAAGPGTAGAAGFRGLRGRSTAGGGTARPAGDDPAPAAGPAGATDDAVGVTARTGVSDEDAAPRRPGGAAAGTRPDGPDDTTGDRL